MRKAEKNKCKGKERQTRIKHTDQRERERGRDKHVLNCTAVQLLPIRGRYCSISKGNVIPTTQAKTFDTKDMSLINFT